MRRADCHDIPDKHARVLATFGCLGTGVARNALFESNLDAPSTFNYRL